MESNKLLVFVMPTNEPDTFFNFFLKGISNLVDLKDHCTFNINFQYPWTEDRIKDALDVLDSYGFKYEYVYHPEGYSFTKPYVPINKIRHDSILTTDGLFYGLMDDDMSFVGPTESVNTNAGIQYLQVIDYMINHDRCGLTLMGGSLVKVVPKYHIGLIGPEVSYLTGKGFVVRSLHDIEGYSDLSPTEVLATKDTLELVGGYEEKMIAGFRLSKGYYPARLGFSKTRHYENHYTVGNGYFSKDATSDTRKNGKVLSGGDEYDWLNVDVTETNINRYIRDKFYLEDIREKVVLKNNITRCVDKRIYFQNGGLEVTEENYSSHLSDYTDVSPEELKDRLTKYAEGVTR